MSLIRMRVLAVAICASILSLSAGSLAAAENAGVADVPFNVDSILSDDELAAEFGPAPAENFNSILGRISNLDRPSSSRMTSAHENVREKLSDELLSHYDAILYVNKAARGSTAQTLRIFKRVTVDGDWTESRRLKVSTGREKQEQYFTSTPVGIFNLDGDRMFKMAYSAKWGGSPMPFAMFFDVQFASRKTGIAIHGAPRNAENKLGSRASGGCIRVGNKDVEELYTWVTGSLKGDVPQFAWDQSRGKTSSEAVLQKDSSGQLVMKKGYKALVVVVDVQD